MHNFQFFHPSGFALARQNFQRFLVTPEKFFEPNQNCFYHGLSKQLPEFQEMTNLKKNWVVFTSSLLIEGKELLVIMWSRE